MNPLLLDLLPWVRQGDCCSQLLMRLALQAMSEENPALLRAMWGFCQGMANSGGPCGFLTGGVAVLGCMAGQDGEAGAHPMAVPLINDYVDWFRQRTAAYGGDSCPRVSAGVTGREADPDGALNIEPDMTQCGDLLAECWGKILELTAAYGIDITEPRRPEHV